MQKGEFSFHLLDALAQPIPVKDWPGLDIRVGSAALPASDSSMTGTEAYPTRFVVSAASDAPDDIYLYIAYPGERYDFDTAMLNPDRAEEYLFLAVPHRIKDVLVVGLARLGDRRGMQPAAGPLFELRFAPGSQRIYRQVSAVNEDPLGAPELVLISAGKGFANLGWEERNIGDYNNNSQVEIADITPVGLYFGQKVAESPTPGRLALVDGDSNGEINIADVTPIGRNFLRYIQGYTVYYANTDTPQSGDFAPLGTPTIARQALYDAATADERRQRLQYSYRAETAIGPNHFYVRAYAGAGTEGPPGNIVSHTAAEQDLPPVWETTVGLTSAIGSGDGIRMTFGRAIDPEGANVGYVLRYVAGGVVGSPGTVELYIPDAVASGDPPYTYYLDGLVRGESYSLNLRAEDEQGNRTINSGALRAAVPALGTSQDTWPYHRFDPARTGSNPVIGLTEPLSEKWSVDLGWSLDQLVPNEPVVSAEGWLAVAAEGSEIRRYDLVAGAFLGGKSGFELPGARPALDGNLIVVGNLTGVSGVDFSDPGAASAYPAGAAVTCGLLLLGDYIIAADQGGVVRAVLVETGEEEWRFVPEPAAPYSLSPAADAQHLYVVNDAGRVDKLQLLTGERLATGNIGAAPSGDALALDSQRGRLYLATQIDRLVVMDATDLGVLQRWPLDPIELAPTSPCLIPHADPPLVVSASSLAIGPANRWRLIALNLNDYSEAWSYTSNSLSAALHITAGSSRIFLLDYAGNLNIFDFSGRLRQVVQLPTP
ncbi:PQQ-binding-like beta-propeller repeat protein, partial [bacterium]|nr:PQQ-binding-like beta-propeller repeat protein [bacterium]